MTSNGMWKVTKKKKHTCEKIRRFKEAVHFIGQTWILSTYLCRSLRKTSRMCRMSAATMLVTSDSFLDDAKRAKRSLSKECGMESCVPLQEQRKLFFQAIVQVCASQTHGPARGVTLLSSSAFVEVCVANDNLQFLQYLHNLHIYFLTS